MKNLMGINGILVPVPWYQHVGCDTKNLGNCVSEHGDTKKFHVEILSKRKRFQRSTMGWDGYQIQGFRNQQVMDCGVMRYQRTHQQLLFLGVVNTQFGPISPKNQ